MGRVRRALSIGVVLLGLATVVVACRNVLPANRYLQPRSVSRASHSTADARHKFDHWLHEKPLHSAGVSCIDCHQFAVKIESGNEELAKALSAHALVPGSAACHSCHTQPDTQMAAAPQACTACHDNLLPLLPDNHKAGWSKAHATVARTDPGSCENCHRQNECIDCHARRDTIETRVHERNFRFFHSVQARANPMQCSSCHRVDYCINCHQQGEDLR